MDRKALAIVLFVAMTARLGYSGTTVMVPMRDSVLLITDIYLPPDTASGPVPVVLNRTPYERNDGGVFKDSLFAHGIGWVCQNTRGRGGSGGEDSIFLDNGWGERQDGYDAVEWLAAQPWCDGRIGVYGGSAHGITAYLCAGAVPPHLVCGFVAHCASNMYKHAAFPGGCYRKEQIDTWYNSMGIDYMLDYIEEHYIYDTTWSTMNLENRFALINTPFYHVAGWYDTFCEGNIDAFIGMQYEGDSGARGNQKIIIGPWCHGAWNTREQGDLVYPENSLWDIVPVATRWFAHYLKDEDNGIEDEPAVRCYIMGDCKDTTAPGNEWIEFDSFPPQDVVHDTLFLHPDQTLRYEPPTAVDTGLTYYCDPANPMHNRGGRNLCPWLPPFWYGRGPMTQFAQDASPQGKIWTTDILTEPLIVVGKVRARIYASSDCIDTDFMVRLCDVYPSGSSYIVLDGAIRARFREGTDHEVFMTPGQVYEFNIELGNIAIVFAAGHRIRVGVSSALFNRYMRSPNTNEEFHHNFWDYSTHTIANNTVRTDMMYPSCIILPILKTYSVEETRIAKPEKPILSVYPNPFNSWCFILTSRDASVEVFDVAGRRLAEFSGGKSMWVPIENIPSGLYFIRAKINNAIAIEKVLYLK